MYTIEKNKTKVEVNLTIDNKEWEEGVQKVYESSKGKFNVEGFRKGHAPRKVIEKTYGDSIFFEDTVDFFVNKVMNEILDKNPELEPVAMPKTKFESYTAQDGLKMKILFEIVPDFKICKYTGNEIKVHSAEVNEHDIEHELHHLLEEHAKFDTVDRAVKNGDIAVIDFIGFIDNVEFEGGSANNYSLEIGSHSFIDNFEEQLIGHKKGETVDVNVTFPSNYPASEFKDKKATFKVTINEVKEKTLPTLDDKFIADATEYETLDEYRKATTAHIQDMKKNDQDAEYEYNIREYLLENTEIDIPEIMVDNFVHQEIHNLEDALKPYNMSVEEYISRTGGTSFEDYLKMMKERTLKSIKTRYIYRKIIELENIVISQEELNEATKGMTNREDIIRTENELSLQKLHKFLKDNNNMVIIPESNEEC